MIAAALLAGALCLSGGPVEAAPPETGTVSVVVKGVGDEAYSAAFRDAAGRALSDKGFTVLDDPGHSAFVVDLTVAISEVGTGTGQVSQDDDPHVINGGVPGAVGSTLRIAVPTAKTRIVALERTQAEMVVRKRSGGEAVWRGAAVTVRPESRRTSIAPDLCAALLRAYPAESESMIGVP